MALSVNVTLVRFPTTRTDGIAGVPLSTPIGTGEIKTTTGSSAQTTLTANAATLGADLAARVGDLAWRIAVPATAVAADLVYVAFGANPTATNANFQCPSGTVNYFAVSAIDEKVAILGPS